MTDTTKREMRARLVAALESGELDAAYQKAKAESDVLRAELEASKHIPPEMWHWRVTI